MTRTLVCLFLFSFSLALDVSVAYTVVLKNGKMIEGTLISENPETYVLKDAGGIQLNLKKTAVDMEKTLSANQPPAVAPVVNPPEPEAKPEPPVVPKKPARTFTEEDLEKLREKYDLGGGAFSDSNQSEGAETAKEEENTTNEKAHSPDDLRSQAGLLRDQMKQAEASYAELKKGCDFSAGMTSQGGDSVTNDKGERLSVAETRKDVCDAAENAKRALEDARRQYEALIRSAKTEGVSQDWLENQ